MAKQEQKSNVNQEYNKAVSGLNLDNSQNNIKKGSLSYALNANVENYDANSINYQNEPGNEACFDFPEGYKLVGKHFIPEQNKIVFFITNPDTGGSEIGYMVNNDCVYRTLVNDDCLNFDINSPILSVVHRITNFGTELYWPDNNGRRYLDIDNIPYIPSDISDTCDPIDSNALDCNKLLLQPNVSIPLIETKDVISGGEITSGAYQFTVQYADSVGNPYTSFFGVTNPTPIADINVASVNFNTPVGKSIIVRVENLLPLGQYDYFNLAVIKTINGVQTPELVGTYFIDETFKEITYTGQIQTDIRLSMNDIFEKFTFYDKADYVTAVQDVLVWKGVTAVERKNYQHIANQIRLQWESYRLPVGDQFEDEVNATNYRGYLRDEVYAFSIVFLLTQGKETDEFHIPGRVKGTNESVYADVPSSSNDWILDTPETPTSAPYWKIYNTASVEGTSPEYDPTDDEYKGPYQFGEMAYWESTEEYPCDEDVWGELAGEKIRHHKMPDVIVSPIIEGSEFVSATTLQSEDVAIFSLGIKIFPSEIQDIIERSSLTQAEKDDIVGFKIVRADRGVNKSIVAKGMLRNVGEYEREGQKFFYPNYPYNDLNADVFLNNVNNAWTQLCNPYAVNVWELPEEDEDGSYFEIEYKSCNSNRTQTIRIRELYTNYDDPYILCSITRPIAQSPGIVNNMRQTLQGPLPEADNVAVIRNLNYERWYVNVGDCLWLTIEWNDAVTGEGTQSLLTLLPNSNNAPSQAIIHVEIDSGGPVKINGNDSDCNLYRIFENRVESELCGEESPLDTLSTLTEETATKQIFNSPETSFGQPFLGNILKVENVMYGAGKGHHVEVKDHAKYKLLTREAQIDALNAAQEVGNITSTFSFEAFIAVYQSYLTIYINGITRKNYAYSFNSIASYNYTAEIPNGQGVKQRKVETKRYLIPQVISIGDTTVNNFQRETSVFLETENTGLQLPHLVDSLITSGVEENSRFTISGAGNCGSPQKEESINVVSYYASLKNEFVNQYGQIYSYESIDTGYVKIFTNDTVGEDTIFGGDTFVGRFAYKTKVPFFFDNRVNAPDDSDIFYDEIGNIAYPRYWHSARSVLESYVADVPGITLPNFISYKATNFDCPNLQTLPGTPNNQNPDRTFYDGFFYLFAYGVPSFYCESSYNLDLRTAFNEKEGNFWPRVTTGIPDEWVQETNVSIANDNTYNYNVAYSKQNKESVITSLPADWGDGEGRTEYPFRAIYSDPLVNDEDNRVNNWLTYRPISQFDFPQNFGALTALDSIKDSAILARFENKSLLYNNLLTIDTSNPQAAYIGNPNLFAGAPPIDYAETDQGYVGCQNKMLLKTPYGAVSVDAKRGQVFLYNGREVKDLTMFGSGMNRWFTAHLPFEILKHFPDVDVDNHYNGIGLHGVFDSNYERVILTKIDYIPLNNDIIYRDGKWYTNVKNTEKEIFLIDSDYFCNVSWTISFNFITNSWISFHSYIPSWYVGENNFFYSGLNFCPNDFDVAVGTLTALPTTTTTTTRLLTTTTSTTLVIVDPECDFDATGEAVDCALTGLAVFVDPEPESPCVVPDNMVGSSFIEGYQLDTPSTTVDTRPSEALACYNMSLYQVYDSANYTPLYTRVLYEGLFIGSKVYVAALIDDCEPLTDGWYFNFDSLITTSVFEVVDGEIADIVVCDVIGEITTTTTTTTLAFVTRCYEGTLTEPDATYPLGGVVIYDDEFGVRQTITEIWDVDTVNINVSKLISTSNVVEC